MLIIQLKFQLPCLSRPLQTLPIRPECQEIVWLVPVQVLQLQTLLQLQYLWPSHNTSGRPAMKTATCCGLKAL
jgi:hypothetical protein